MLEDMAVDPGVHSSLGPVGMTLMPGGCSAPSRPPVTSLAWGWAFASDRHTSTPSGWLTGATAGKPFARFSGFLGCPRDNTPWPLWGAGLRLAAPWVPAGEGMQGSCDAPTQGNTGTHPAGLARYRHGAGSARQGCRTRRGVHGVPGLRPLPLPRWPGPGRRVPGGGARARNAPPAHPLPGPSPARRQ